MNRPATASTALCLLALMAAAGLLGSGVGLLMLSPFFLFLLPLLIDIYPGERLLESLISLFDAFAHRRAGLAGVQPAPSPPHRRSVSIAGPIGSRGPPRCFA